MNLTRQQAKSLDLRISILVWVCVIATFIAAIPINSPINSTVPFLLIVGYLLLLIGWKHYYRRWICPHGVTWIRMVVVKQIGENTATETTYCSDCGHTLNTKTKEVSHETESKARGQVPLCGGVLNEEP